MKAQEVQILDSRVDQILGLLGMINDQPGQFQEFCYGWAELKSETAYHLLIQCY